MNEGLYRTILDNLTDGVYFLDADRRITYWSKGAEKLTGFPSHDVVGKRCADGILAHVNDTGCSLCAGNCPMRQTIVDGRRREVEVSMHHKDGHRIPVIISSMPIKDDSGRITGAVEIFSDNTARDSMMAQLEELQRTASLDPLTKLANRRHIEAQLQSRLDEFRRYGWVFGVLFMDVDGFKRVNDTLGHDAGDLVLKMVARTLANSLRSFDIPGRWGGDEFIAVVTNVNADQLRSVADKVRSLVAESYIANESGTLRVTASIGAVLAQFDDSIESLVKRADKLMFASKAAGKNAVSVE
jgi:diguanylate cyclase (GGDEF)-like protein/PAS domain S-box-containing protein